MMRIFCVANQKGGVGKTTTTVNLAAGLARLGRRTLVVDLDPQGNATMGSGIDKRALDLSVYDVLLENAGIAEVRQTSPKGGYDVVGANRELAGAEVELVGLERRDRRLRSALAAVADDYDFVLIDCPPSLSLLTLNGLSSAHGVVVPMQCEYFALEGLSDLVNTIKQVHANLNPELEVIGILRVMFDPRITLQSQVSEQLKAHFGEKVFDTVIPRNVRLAEAPSYGMPGVVFDPASKGAQRLSRVRARDGGPRRCLARAAGSMSASGATPPAGRAELAGLSRIEDAGINATAPREQLWIDGWLVRLSPGKAKRARCIQPVAAGRLDIDAKLAICLPLYAAAGLRPYVRITPFAEPAGLDRHLAALGMAFARRKPGHGARLARAASRGAATKRPHCTWQAAEPRSFADWVGGARGSTPTERSAHAERIAHSTVPHHALLLRDADGTAVAGGQVAIEGRIVGLYDIFTVAEARGRGYAERVCRHLLALAAERGADDGLPAGRRRKRARAPALSPPRLQRRLSVSLPHPGGPGT